MVMFIFTILLLFLIALTYYSLAKEHNKSNLWLWAIIGIVVYYVGGIILAFFFGVFGFLLMDLLSASSEGLNIQGLENLLGLIGGIIGSFVLYRYLKHRWAKSAVDNEDVLDEEF